MYFNNCKRLEIADISTYIDSFMQQFHPIEYRDYYMDCGNKKRNVYSFKSEVSNALMEQNEKTLKLINYLSTEFLIFEKLLDEEPENMRYKLAVTILAGIFEMINDYFKEVNQKDDYIPNLKISDLEAQVKLKAKG